MNVCIYNDNKFANIYININRAEKGEKKVVSMTMYTASMVIQYYFY